MRWVQQGLHDDPRARVAPPGVLGGAVEVRLVPGSGAGFRGEVSRAGGAEDAVFRVRVAVPEWAYVVSDQGRGREAELPDVR